MLAVLCRERVRAVETAEDAQEHVLVAAYADEDESNNASDDLLVDRSQRLVDEFERRVEQRVQLDERRADYLLKLRAAAEELFHDLREADESLDEAERGAEQHRQDEREVL